MPKATSKRTGRHPARSSGLGLQRGPELLRRRACSPAQSAGSPSGPDARLRRRRPRTRRRAPRARPGAAPARAASSRSRQVPERRLENRVDQVASIPRVHHEDAIRLLDRLQPVDALEEEPERAGRVPLERGRRQRFRTPGRRLGRGARRRLSAHRSPPVPGSRRGRAGRPAAAGAGAPAPGGPRAPASRATPARRAAARGRPAAPGEAGRVRQPGNWPERLEVVALAGHRLQQVQHEERRHARPPALRVDAGIRQDARGARRSRRPGRSARARALAPPPRAEARSARGAPRRAGWGPGAARPGTRPRPGRARS